MSYVLATQRLALAPVAARDHAVLLAHWTEPQVRRSLFDGMILSAADVARAIEDSARSFEEAGYGLWLIRERDGGGLAGTAGLRPLEDLGLEIIYSLAPCVWGKGYATEAARAVVDYALGSMGLPEVLAEIDTGNRASAAVAERLGMVPFAEVDGLLGPMTRYRTTR